MEKNMGDLNWRMKSYRVLLLLLIPVFYFSALFYMGKKSKQDGYIKLGLFFGAVSVVTFIAVVMGLVFQPLFYALILHLGCWAMCVIQTLRLRQQYLQYLEWAIEDEEKKRDPLVFKKSWRRRNALWCLWDCVPFMGGLATYFMGRRLENRKLMWVGVGSFLLTVVAVVAAGVLPQVDQTTGAILIAAVIILAYSTVCVHPLLSGYYFEEYLDATAAMWNEDLADYPVMKQIGWRVKNSLWQIATFIPYLGTFGLLFVGLHRENGKVLLKASLLCVAELICLAGPSMLMGNAELLQAYPMLVHAASTVSVLWVFVYLLMVFFGAVIRWDMLRERAQMLEEEE